MADDRYTEKETQRRAEAALRAAFKTPHKTYEESKIGKGRTPTRRSPAKDRPVEKPG